MQQKTTENTQDNNVFVGEMLLWENGRWTSRFHTVFKNQETLGNITQENRMFFGVMPLQENPCGMSSWRLHI